MVLTSWSDPDTAHNQNTIRDRYRNHREDAMRVWQKSVCPQHKGKFWSWLYPAWEKDPGDGVFSLLGPSVSPQVRRVLIPSWTKCRSHVKHIVNSVARHEGNEDAPRKVSCCIPPFVIVCLGNLTRQKEPCPCCQWWQKCSVNLSKRSRMPGTQVKLRFSR